MPVSAATRSMAARASATALARKVSSPGTAPAIPDARQIETQARKPRLRELAGQEYVKSVRSNPVKHAGVQENHHRQGWTGACGTPVPGAGSVDDADDVGFGPQLQDALAE